MPRVTFRNPLDPDLGTSPDPADVPFFQMDYSSGEDPDAGWTLGAFAPGGQATFSRTRVATGGPSGQACYELTQEANGGEYYWGWRGDVEAQAPTAGDTRFYRWRIKWSADTNFEGLDGVGDPRMITNKILILGDSCGSSCRVILNYNGRLNQQAFFRIQIDGGDHYVDTGDVNVGVWLDVQAQVTTATTGSSANATYKIWVNNNVFASPDAVNSGFQLNPTLHHYVIFGGYNNDELAPGGVHSFRVTDFEVSETFDSAWH